MKPATGITLIALTAIAMFAQQPQLQRMPSHQMFEVASAFPRETSPGQYAQVDPQELQRLSAEGWELVGVTPYIYRNEEHANGEMHGPKPVVTQVYPAYFFKRLRSAPLTR